MSCQPAPHATCSPAPPRRSRAARLTALAVGLPCWAVLIVSAWLHADGRGYDTHTQLGLPPCGLVQTTGWPCPTCGMTTAFAAMAHGNIASAVGAQAFGAVLFMLVLLAGAVSAALVVMGRPWPARWRPKAWWAWALPAALLAGWALKVVTGLAGGTLPVR